MEFAKDLRHALKLRIGDERFELWFRDVALLNATEASGSVVQVVAATSFQLDRVRKNFQPVITVAASDIGLSDPLRVDFRVESDSEEFARLLGVSRNVSVPAKPVSPAAPKAAENAAVSSASSAPKPTRLRATSATTRKRKFQSMAKFVKGECNQIACTSANMVTQQLGDITPLVIHGPTGVGKSHLAEGIWSESRQRMSQSRVLFLSAEQYTTYFLDALRGGHGLPAFRRKYRQADLLIIDDIQFFAGKQATLVELAYTIDELSRQGRQLILTADRPPAQLAKLGPEIVNRLCGGLVCKMKPIDGNTMEQISRQWATDRNIAIPDEIHRTLAGKMNGDARQLSGVLNRLWATSVATGERITARMVHEVLFELVPTSAKIIRLQDVRKAICDVFCIEVDSLLSSKRGRAVTAPRMLAMWFARRHTAAGLHEISQFFGRRSHSSAVTASNTVDKWLATAEKIEVNGHPCDIRDIVSQIEAGMKAG